MEYARVVRKPKPESETPEQALAKWKAGRAGLYARLREEFLSRRYPKRKPKERPELGNSKRFRHAATFLEKRAGAVSVGVGCWIPSKLVGWVAWPEWLREYVEWGTDPRDMKGSE